MQLDAHELHDLAGFFGRRFPASSAQELADAAGVPLPPSAGWTTLVTEAARQQRLPQLVAAAKRARPGDAGVAALEQIVRPARRLPRTAMVAAALAALLLVGAALAWPEAPPAAPEPAVASVSATPAIDPAPAAAALPVETPPAPAPVETPQAAVLQTAPEAAPATTSATGTCAGEAGAVVGYFHAGSQSPGAQGQTITLSRGARVRADYPDVHNRHNASAPVRCVLPPGSRVRLDAAPITVPGRAVWVPLVAGSVL